MPTQRVIQIIIEFKPTTTHSLEDAKRRGEETLAKIETVCTPEHTEINVWDI